MVAVYLEKVVVGPVATMNVIFELKILLLRRFQVLLVMQAMEDKVVQVTKQAVQQVQVGSTRR